MSVERTASSGFHASFWTGSSTPIRDQTWTTLAHVINSCALMAAC